MITKENDLVKNKRQQVEQAFASAHVLTEEQKRKRIQDKIDRARRHSEALKRIDWRARSLA